MQRLVYGQRICVDAYAIAVRIRVGEEMRAWSILSGETGMPESVVRVGRLAIGSSCFARFISGKPPGRAAALRLFPEARPSNEMGCEKRQEIETIFSKGL